MRTLLRLLSLFLALALPTVARAQQKLEVGYIPVLGISQLFVIVGEGWDKEAGLELKLIRFDSGPVMIQALSGKQLDAYYGGIGPVIVARGSDIDARVIANTAIEEMTVVATGPFAKTLEENKSVTAAIAAFTKAEGRKPKFSTQPLGSVPDTTLRYWLQKVSSVELATVDIVGMGIDKTQQAVLAGAVDAATIREPALTLVREKDPQIKLVALGGQMFPKQPGSVVAVTGEALKAKGAALAKLVALHVRATELIKKEPERAAKHAHHYLGRGLTDVATIRRALTSPSSQFAADPHEIVESTRIMQDFQISMGVLKKPVPMEQLFDFSLWSGVKSGK